MKQELSQEQRARESLQHWKASKMQLIAVVENQAKKYAHLNIDVDEIAEQMSMWQCPLSCVWV